MPHKLLRPLSLTHLILETRLQLAQTFPISPLYLSDHKFLDNNLNLEYDDYLYTLESDSRRYKNSWRRKTLFEYLNAIALFLVVAALLVLMLVYPVIRYGIVGTWSSPHKGGSKILGWGLGGINATGQVPKVVVPGLIDLETPDDAKTRIGFDGERYNLVFSDEVSFLPFSLPSLLEAENHESVLISRLSSTKMDVLSGLETILSGKLSM
jgi:hypothetical protein